MIHDDAVPERRFYAGSPVGVERMRWLKAIERARVQCFASNPWPPQFRLYELVENPKCVVATREEEEARVLEVIGTQLMAAPEQLTCLVVQLVLQYRADDLRETLSHLPKRDVDQWHMVAMRLAERFLDVAPPGFASAPPSHWLEVMIDTLTAAIIQPQKGEDPLPWMSNWLTHVHRFLETNSPRRTAEWAALARKWASSSKASDMLAAQQAMLALNEKEQQEIAGK